MAVSTQALLEQIELLDGGLFELLQRDVELLVDDDLNEIQHLIQQRKQLLAKIDSGEIENLLQQQDKGWQDLAYRTHNLVKLATYRKDDIRERIEKRGRGRRSIAAYQQHLN